MKVFFDHNIQRKLCRPLKGHSVSIAAEVLWATLENGALLRAAEDEGFEVMVTAGKNLSHQQNLFGKKRAWRMESGKRWGLWMAGAEKDRPIGKETLLSGVTAA